VQRYEIKIKCSIIENILFARDYCIKYNYRATKHLLIISYASHTKRFFLEIALLKIFIQKKSIFRLRFFGAWRGNRTPTSLQIPDFESSASTSSAIQAYLSFFVLGMSLLFRSRFHRVHVRQQERLGSYSR
jgi:hypothetical protein